MIDVGGVAFLFIDQIDFPYYKNFAEKKNQFKPQKRMLMTCTKEKRLYKNRTKGDGVGYIFFR